jgi:hypothetical protein
MIELFRLYRSISSYLYFGLLTIMAIMLPYSVYVVSMCQIGLCVNFIIEGEYKKRFRNIAQKKSLLIFLSIYAVHLLWMLGTNDLASGIENLRIKLPILLLPFFIAVSVPLDKNWIKILLKFFIASVVSATLVSTAIYLGFTPYKINDVRGISIFISHIRFSLLIVICILVLLKWIVTEGWKIDTPKVLYGVLVVWLIIFLMLLKSLTGLIVLTVTVYVLIFVFIRTIKFQFLKIGAIFLLFAIPLTTLIIVRNQVNKFYDFEKIDIKSLDKKTVNGNPYYHNPDDWNVENGQKLSLYICQPELRKEWNTRSNYKYDSLDMKQQPLYYTLMRYMTSKGLKKDSVGITQLSQADISNIEHGITNVIYAEKLGLKSRIYEVIWEFDQYRHGAGVNKHSVTQRIVYMHIAVELIKDNFWFGIGTGDLNAAYANYYQTHDTGLSKDRQFLTHNEFLRFFVVFGFIGFLIIMAAFILPVFIEKKWFSYYFIMIFIIVFLSFLNEDTLESHIGVTFSIMFYSLFLWGVKKEDSSE